jgi:hypothetical protein
MRPRTGSALRAQLERAFREQRAVRKPIHAAGRCLEESIGSWIIELGGGVSVEGAPPAWLRFLYAGTDARVHLVDPRRSADWHAGKRHNEDGVG